MYFKIFLGSIECMVKAGQITRTKRVEKIECKQIEVHRSPAPGNSCPAWHSHSLVLPIPAEALDVWHLGHKTCSVPCHPHLDTWRCCFSGQDDKQHQAQGVPGCTVSSSFIHFYKCPLRSQIRFTFTQKSHSKWVYKLFITFTN